MSNQGRGRSAFKVLSGSTYLLGQWKTESGRRERCKIKNTNDVQCKSAQLSIVQSSQAQ